MTILFLIAIILGCISLLGNKNESEDYTGCLIMFAVVGAIMFIISLIVK